MFIGKKFESFILRDQLMNSGRRQQKIMGELYIGLDQKEPNPSRVLSSSGLVLSFFPFFLT